MESLETFDRKAFIEQGLRRAEQVLGQVADIVNAAANGRLIRDSEGPCHEALEEFQRRIYELAVQDRIKATEDAVAFSPSAPRQPRVDPPPHADDLRVGRDGTPTLQKRQRRHRRVRG
jgi:hypothetical protein